MIVYVIALAIAVLLVLAMLALGAFVIVGAIAVGNLWLLLPLAFYALAFWMLAQLIKSM